MTAVESGEEGLGGELVGQLAVKTAAQIAVDRRKVTFEDRAKGPRFRERGGDHVAVD
ncbi:hypothetical protein D3C83_289030 [compost metagenome]